MQSLLNSHLPFRMEHAIFCNCKRLETFSKSGVAGKATAHPHNGVAADRKIEEGLFEMMWRGL